MGLDSFKSDGDSNDKDSESQNGEEEATSENQGGGLESFRTTKTSGGSGNGNGKDEEEQSAYGIDHAKLAGMTLDERVRYVRNNGIPDFYPDHQPDDRWSWRRKVEVRCVCGENLTFSGEVICDTCKREYEDTGRTVVKTNEPTETSDNT